DRGFGKIDRIDRFDEWPLCDRALQPSLATAQHENAQIATVKIATGPGRQPIARRIARGPFVEMHQDGSRCHPAHFAESVRVFGGTPALRGVHHNASTIASRRDSMLADDASIS